MKPDLERAAGLMADATSNFIQPDYALEALEALTDAGWKLTPPPTITITVVSGPVCPACGHRIPQAFGGWQG